MCGEGGISHNVLVAEIRRFEQIGHYHLGHQCLSSGTLTEHWDNMGKCILVEKMSLECKMHTW
jgi:hypothetical protein